MEARHHSASQKQPSTRQPAKARPSRARSLKSKHKKASQKLPLKAFVAALADDAGKAQREDWLFNKRSNFSKPPLCVGRTRMRVKKGGGGKLDGKQKETLR